MHFYFKGDRQNVYSVLISQNCIVMNLAMKITQQLPKCSCSLKGMNTLIFLSLWESLWQFLFSSPEWNSLHSIAPMHKHFATVHKETWNVFLTIFASWLTDEEVSINNKLPMLWCRHNLFFISSFVIYYPNRMNTFICFVLEKINMH